LAQGNGVRGHRHRSLHLRIYIDKDVIKIIQVDQTKSQKLDVGNNEQREGDPLYAE
jgi:hypothetical protein